MRRSEGDTMDAVRLLLTRRSVKPRDMRGPGPSSEQIDTILTIGARVPDHGKLAPWRFIVIEGDARQRAGEAIARIYAKNNPSASAEDIGKASQAFMEAPLVIAVVSIVRPHPKVPPWEQELSAGASCMAIVTAVTAMGFGANWLTGWYAFDPEAMAALGLAPEEKIAGFIHIGGVAERPEDRPRPALIDVVTRF